MSPHTPLLCIAVFFSTTNVAWEPHALRNVFHFAELHLMNCHFIDHLHGVVSHTWMINREWKVLSKCPFTVARHTSPASGELAVSLNFNRLACADLLHLNVMETAQLSLRWISRNRGNSLQLVGSGQHCKQHKYPLLFAPVLQKYQKNENSTHARS